MRGEVPTLMVSSTYYDLRELRQQLGVFVERDLGYRVLISESSDFPIDPDAEAIENCRRRVEQNADALVLVIGGRYGHVESASGRSVTNLEYLGARAKGIPIFAFIENRTLILHDEWSKSSGGQRDALEGTVDDSRLFQFVHEVRSGDSVWMIPFDHAAEIILSLRAQLAYQMQAGLDLLRGLRTSPERDFLRGLTGSTLRLALDKPQAWEFRLFAQALRDEIEESQELRRQYDLRIVFGSNESVADADFPTWSQLRMSELSRNIQIASRLVNETLLEALGPPGTPGSAPKIVSVARNLGRVYRDAIEWAARVRRVHPESDDFGELVEALAATSSEIVVKLGKWAANLGSEIEDALMESKRVPVGGQPKHVLLTLVLGGEVFTQLIAQMREVYHRRGIEFE
jgi:hypothetical protein